MIQITKPFMPPRKEYEEILKKIWKREWLTNNGPLVKQLEYKLKEYLNVKHLLYVTNGTIALQLAIKALDLRGEIITTPFTYIATASSIVWEGCTPVFVDIDSKTLNIDPLEIEGAITKNTQAILATHCFGNPCDVEAISAIAQKFKLKIIYDAAHCFGTRYKEKSIFNWGDVSTTSFHATKLFHTIEGGAVFANNLTIHNRMAYMRNFGHAGPEKFEEVGINGKNSEFHAGMGICNLNYIDKILQTRKIQSKFYDKLLQGLDLNKPAILPNAEFNYSYYPIIFNDEQTTLKVKSSLEKAKIFPRRYFFPSLSSLNYVDKAYTPIADDISSRILCLPLYHTLTMSDQIFICKKIINTLLGNRGLMTLLNPVEDRR